MNASHLSSHEATQWFVRSIALAGQDRMRLIRDSNMCVGAVAWEATGEWSEAPEGDVGVTERAYNGRARQEAVNGRQPGDAKVSRF